MNVLGKKRMYSRIIRNIFQNNKRMNWGKNKGMYSRIIREWIGKKENVFQNNKGVYSRIIREWIGKKENVF